MTPPKRGALGNPPNRFERLQVILDEEVAFEKRSPATSYFRDDAQTIISRTESPDIGEHKPINSELVSLAAKTITVKGKLVSRDGVNVIENGEIVKK